MGAPTRQGADATEAMGMMGAGACIELYELRDKRVRDEELTSV